MYRRTVLNMAGCLVIFAGIYFVYADAQHMDPRLSRGVQEPVADVPRNDDGWKLTTLAEGLEHPWAMAFLPDGSMLITERPGRLRIYRDGKLLEEPVTGVPEVLAFRQGGLLDVALHPEFEQNRYVYLSFSHGTRQANHTRVVRGKYRDGALRDVQVIFDAEPEKRGGFHFGSRLVFLPDNSLLISVGDAGHSRHEAQNLANHLGSVVRVKDDGAVATGNPFHPRVDATPEIYTYGHRNIQGMTINEKTQEVWATEHGPRGGDELNLIIPGNNYGWPKVTYGKEYSGQTITQTRTLPNMADPHVIWTPSIAASGLTFYHGDKFPQWQGDLFAGGLVAREIRRMDFEDGKIVDQDAIPIGRRVRDVREGPRGYLYVLTDHENSQLLRIEPADD